MNKRTKSFIEGLKEGNRLFGETVGIIINSILLTIAYLLGAGLSKLIIIVSGKKILDKYPDKERTTYWKDINLTLKKKEEYYKQF